MIELFPDRRVILEIGALSLRWYGLLYILAVALGVWVVKKLQEYRELELSWDDLWELATFILIGVVVGGRLGYGFLYDPGYFLENPDKIVAIWEGGMASHGGIVGAGLAVGLFSTLKKISFWKLADVLAVAGALGIAIGRIGNVINQELGDVQIVAVFGHGLVALGLYLTLIHPSYLLRAPSPYPGRRDLRPGMIIGLWLVGYSVVRMIVEVWRPVEWSGVGILTRGQVYTLPLLLLGLSLWLRPNFLRNLISLIRNKDEQLKR